MLNPWSKKLTLMSVLGLLISTISANPVRIKGELKNSSRPYFYVYRFFGPELAKVDSFKHVNGTFQYKFKELPRGFYRLGNSEEKSVMVLLGEDNITITGDLNQPDNVTVKDSKENQVYRDFKKFNDKHNQEINLVNQKAQELSSLQYSNPEAYNTEIQKLQKTVDSLNALQRRVYSDIVNNNQGLIVTKFISMFDFPQNLTKENFFRKEDFTDPEITRGDMLPSKITFYFQRFVTAQLDKWKEAGKELLQMAPAGTQNKEVLYLTLIKMVLPYDDAYARELAKAYNQEYPQSEFSKRILAKIPKGAPEVGEQAPDIQLQDPSGKKVSLSSLKGKVVLLDFWASWCGPCRRENPNVVAIYNKYKDKGFTIFSVSLDNAKDNWVQAIKADQLSWGSHVSDLKGWKSSAAALYGVKSIPQTFLLDKDGKVLAVNLRGESLEAALREIFKE